MKKNGFGTVRNCKVQPEFLMSGLKAINNAPLDGFPDGIAGPEALRPFPKPRYTRPFPLIPSTPKPRTQKGTT